MKCFFRRRRCVWGRDIEMLTLRVADPVGRGFLRSGTEPKKLLRLRLKWPAIEMKSPLSPIG